LIDNIPYLVPPLTTDSGVLLGQVTSTTLCSFYRVERTVLSSPAEGLGKDWKEGRVSPASTFTLVIVFSFFTHSILREVYLIHLIVRSEEQAAS
jgi:hypothetical protein